jgi:proton-coupled amino acid transporter
VRKIEKFSSTHIFADFIILFTVTTIVVYTIIEADNTGFAPDPVFLNTSNFLDIIGFAVYCYEGVGLVLPVLEITSRPD